MRLDLKGSLELNEDESETHKIRCIASMLEGHLSEMRHVLNSHTYNKLHWIVDEPEDYSIEEMVMEVKKVISNLEEYEEWFINLDKELKGIGLEEE